MFLSFSKWLQPSLNPFSFSLNVLCCARKYQQNIQPEISEYIQYVWVYAFALLSAVSCGSIENGRVKPGSFFHRRKRTFECNAGYIAENDNKRIECTSSGWSPVPRCIRKWALNKVNFFYIVLQREIHCSFYSTRDVLKYLPIVHGLYAAYLLSLYTPVLEQNSHKGHSPQSTPFFRILSKTPTPSSQEATLQHGSAVITEMKVEGKLSYCFPQLPHQMSCITKTKNNMCKK